MIHGLDFFICLRGDVAIKNNVTCSFYVFYSDKTCFLLPNRVCLGSYLLYIINCHIEGLWREGATAKQLLCFSKNEMASEVLVSISVKPEGGGVYMYVGHFTFQKNFWSKSPLCYISLY